MLSLTETGASLSVSWEHACVVQASLMKENNLLKMCLLTFCLQIAGTCHEKEQEIILRCFLTSCAEPRATRIAAPQMLRSLTRLLGKAFRGVYVTPNRYSFN